MRASRAWSAQASPSIARRPTEITAHYPMRMTTGRGQPPKSRVLRLEALGEEDGQGRWVQETA